MGTPFYFGAGGVVSADIAVPEHEKELAFYASVLTTGSEPIWRDDLSNRHGTPIIGLGQRTPEYNSLPLQWMPHIQVVDVAECVTKALEFGGQELMHGRDNEGNSLWAGLADPHGAAFGVIPVVDEATASAYQSDGVPYVSWMSLVSSDVQASCEFYERVIGWNVSPAEADGSRMLRRHDGADAGEITPTGDGDIPAVWLLHLPVGDLRESLRRVDRQGGTVLWQSSDPGRAIVQDPVGVCIGLRSHG